MDASGSEVIAPLHSLPVCSGSAHTCNPSRLLKKSQEQKVNQTDGPRPGINRVILSRKLGSDKPKAVITSALRRLRQENGEFQDSLRYTARTRPVNIILDPVSRKKDYNLSPEQ